MQKPPEMQLPPEIRAALEKIDFINRYKSLAARYKFKSDERFKNYDNNEVSKIFAELGYPARYDKRENFFQIVEEYPSFQFGFHIYLKYALLELIWVVRKDGELLIGDPWDWLKQLLDGTDERFRAAGFRNYDLREILKEAFEMYEDFKRVLLETTDPE
jgi:hypothetical protein